MRRLILLIAAFSLLVPACKGNRGGYGPGSAVPVTVGPVKTQESSPSVMVPGVLQVRDKVELRLDEPVKVLSVYANQGDYIEKGTVLAKLSDEEISLRLNQLRAEQVEMATLYEKNLYLLKNRDSLLAERKIDKSQYDGLETETSSNEATLNRVKADIAVEEYKLNHAEIVSPISGVITFRGITSMETINPGQILFTIVDADPILVVFSLTSDEAAGINVGTFLTVSIDDLDGEEYNAQVSYIGPELYQTGKTFEVRGSMPNPSGTLKSGMLATATFTSTKTHRVFVVPDTAVISRGHDKYLYTVIGGVAHKTKIKIRNIYKGAAEISSGLSENDMVVVKGAENLQDGTTVEMWRR